MRLFLRKKHIPDAQQLALTDAYSPERDRAGSGQKRNSPLFHIYSSTIKKDSFSFKLSYEGRSFLLAGDYRIELYRSFADNTCQSKATGVKIERSYRFQNNDYILSSLTGKLQDIFVKEISRVLNDVYINPYLEVSAEPE